MELVASVSLTELEKILDQMAPLRLHLQVARPGETGPQRWIELRDPTVVELVPGKGLRVVCTGAVRYDLGPIHPGFKIRMLSVVLVPSVTRSEDGSAALTLALDIEKADTAIPDGIEAVVVAAINEIFEPKAEHGVFRVDHAMKAKVPLPPQLVPLEALHVGATWSAVRVLSDRIEITVRLDAGITRTEVGLPSVEEVAARDAADAEEAERVLRDPGVPSGVVAPERSP